MPKLNASELTHTACGHVLGLFLPGFDHGSTNMKCPKCDEWVAINTSTLCEFADNPDDYEFPVEDGALTVRLREVKLTKAQEAALQ